MIELKKLSEIIFRKDLYPRFNPDQKLIEQYANSVEFLPPIKINQNNILIDGYHRWKALQLANIEDMEVEVVETDSEAGLKIMAYRLNSHHGKQLSSDEKQAFAQQMCRLLTITEIKDILSVDRTTVEDWTQTQRENIEKEQLRKIMELYLKAENTHEKIAEILDIPRQTITDKIKAFAEKGNFPDFGKDSDFEPYIYNIWNLAKADKQTSHFGYFPEKFFDNLLYYHTEPFQKVYDPFAGTGTTVDICKKRYRRYYCSDLVVKPGREDDVKQWDITNGLPEDLPKPDFVFLDPPYWKQAQGKYSDLKTDLSNMDLDSFYESMSNLLKALMAKRCFKIAIVISPTQYPNENHIFEDHIFRFHEILYKKYKIEMRYSIPYSTEQYNGTQVDIMKQEKKAISTIRDLVVWALEIDN